MIIIPNSNLNFSDLPKHTLTAVVIVFNLYFICAFLYSFNIFQNENFVGSYWDWSFNQDVMESFRNKSRYETSLLFWVPFFIFDGALLATILIASIAKLISKTERYIKLNW